MGYPEQSAKKSGPVQKGGGEIVLVRESASNMKGRRRRSGEKKRR